MPRMKSAALGGRVRDVDEGDEGREKSYGGAGHGERVGQRKQRETVQGKVACCSAGEGAAQEERGSKRRGEGGPTAACNGGRPLQWRGARQLAAHKNPGCHLRASHSPCWLAGQAGRPAGTGMRAGRREGRCFSSRLRQRCWTGSGSAAAVVAAAAAGRRSPGACWRGRHKRARHRGTALAPVAWPAQRADQVER